MPCGHYTDNQCGNCYDWICWMCMPSHRCQPVTFHFGTLDWPTLFQLPETITLNVPQVHLPDNLMQDALEIEPISLQPPLTQFGPQQNFSFGLPENSMVDAPPEFPLNLESPPPLFGLPDNSMVDAPFSIESNEYWHFDSNMQNALTDEALQQWVDSVFADEDDSGSLPRPTSEFVLDVGTSSGSLSVVNNERDPPVLALEEFDGDLMLFDYKPPAPSQQQPPVSDTTMSIDSGNAGAPSTGPSFLPFPFIPFIPPQIQSAPLNEAPTTIKLELKPAVPVALSLRCMLWNIANLGGKFGYPKRRADEVMSAIAYILNHSNSDVIAILEVLDRNTERVPKPPLAPRVGGKSDFFDRVFDIAALTVTYALEGGNEKKKKRTQALEIADKALSEAKRKRKEAIDRVTKLFEDAVQSIVWDGNNPTEIMDDPLHGAGNCLKTLRTNLKKSGGIEHLINAEYTHWTQSYSPNYTTKQKKDSEEKKLEDDTSAYLLQELHAGVKECWKKFLADEFKTKLDEGEATSAFNVLACRDFDKRYKLYEERKKAIQKEKSESKSESPHDGLREFFRIRDELNKLNPDDPYESWPDKLPDTDKIYTCGETYGVLYRKSRLTIEGDVSYAGAYRSKSFQKREPLRIPLRLAGGPVIVFFPWHAPSPSGDNAEYRGKDFPTFIQLCDEEQKEGNLSILLSDLNIDTANGMGLIEHCKPGLTQDGFFTGVTGTKLFKSYAKSTLVMKNIEKERIDDLNLRLSDLGSQRGLPGRYSSGQTLIAIIAKHVRAPQEDDIEEEQPTRNILAHGASAYDKILPIHRTTKGYRLESRGDVVIPFPHALAFDQEMALFPPAPLSGGRFPSFACLLERLKAEEILAKIRGDSRPESDLTSGMQEKRVKELVKCSRKLSDHMPLLADFVIRTLTSEGKPVSMDEPQRGKSKLPPPKTSSPKPTTSTDSPPSPESEIEKLCQLYESAKDDEGTRSGYLELLLKKVDSLGLSDKEAQKINARIQRTLDGLSVVEKEPGDAKTEKARPSIKHPNPLVLDNLQNHDNGGGGDCLFRSLSQLIYGTQEHHALVRTHSVAHLRAILSTDAMEEHGGFGPEVASREILRGRLLDLYNWHQEAWPFSAPYNRRGLGIWQRYLLEMARPGVWGDLIVLGAASHLYGIRVRLIVKTGGDYFQDRVDFCATLRPGAQDVILFNYDNYHFEAVTAKGINGPGLLEPPPKPVNTISNTPTGILFSSNTTGSSHPVPSGKVFKWPSDDSTDFWDIPDAKKYPACIFVFGENHADRNATDGSPGTQANIRGQANAYGIRTCLKPGANVSQGGAMQDSDQTENEKMIEADIERIRQAIRSKAFQTLIIPWCFKKLDPTDPNKKRMGTHALGLGVAKLPDVAPITFASLTTAVKKLMLFAEQELPVVAIDTRGTSAQRNDVIRKPDTLFVFEDCDALRNSQLTLDHSSVSLRNLTNALGIRTSLQPAAKDLLSGWMDDNNGGHQAMIDEDLKAIRLAMKSGKYLRLSLPWNLDGTNTTLIGTASGLQIHAPKIFAYLQQAIKQLIEECAKITSGGLRTGLGNSPSDGLLDEREEDDTNDGSQSNKKVKTKPGSNQPVEKQF